MAGSSRENIATLFWAKVKLRLGDLNLRRQAISNVVGITRTNLVSNEICSKVPRLTAAFKIARSLGLPLENLLSYKEHNTTVLSKSISTNNNQFDDFIDMISRFKKIPEDCFWILGEDKVSINFFLKSLEKLSSESITSSDSFYNIMSCFLLFPYPLQISLFQNIIYDVRNQLDLEGFSNKILFKQDLSQTILNAFSSTLNDEKIKENFWKEIIFQKDYIKKISTNEFMKAMNLTAFYTTSNSKYGAIYKDPRLDTAIDFCKFFNISLDTSIRNVSGNRESINNTIQNQYSEEELNLKKIGVRRIILSTKKKSNQTKQENNIIQSILDLLQTWGDSSFYTQLFYAFACMNEKNYKKYSEQIKTTYNTLKEKKYIIEM